MSAGLRSGIATALLAALPLLPAAARAADKPLPIVFVHGNGDDAAVWMTTIWRFESNDYPAELLEAVDLRYPLAGKLYDAPEPGHSTAAEETAQLAEAVAAVQRRTHAPKVILVAQSRGGNILRNYLKNAGGAAHTAIAILCGTPGHGIVVSDKLLVGSEFNGASPFLRDLNAGASEVVPGVRFLTIRSDGNDKYAQPDGRFIGQPGLATGIDADGPALKGATNLVIPRADQRETGFGREAFAQMYKFITGHEPKTREVRPERAVTLEGKVSAFEAGAPTNIGVANAVVEVYKVSTRTGERIGNALLRKITGEDGSWGPVKVEPKAHYEFILAVPGFAVTHIYRSSFPRSSRYVDLRPQLLAKDDREAGAIVYVSRPRGYFGVDRDRFLLDGALPSGIAPGVPSVSMAKKAFPAEPQRTVEAVLNRERIALRTWPLADDQVSVAEFTW
ncbi:MAG TPA: alpha/beta fold hydrolase [Stellaceae bacterium]|nr:alpha/beta fold hydrolase [Stellaceae bacterium]